MSDDFNDRDFDRMYDQIESTGEIEFTDASDGDAAPAPLPMPISEYPIEVIQNDHWQNKVNEKRRFMFEQEFAIAERWAHKPGLTNTERCHGVVWDMHRTRDLRAQEDYDRRLQVYDDLLEANPDLPAAHIPVEPSYRAPEYAKYYDEYKAPEIREFLAKSSKELFD